MEISDNFEELIAEKYALQRRLNTRIINEGKKLLLNTLKEFFTNNPVIDAIRWEGYTPYFNDGSECIYSIYGVRFLSSLFPDEEGEYGDNYIDNDNIGRKFVDHKWVDDDDPIIIQLRENCENIRNIIEEAGDILKTIFEDHKQITVTKDGECEVEEYEHE